METILQTEQIIQEVEHYFNLPEGGLNMNTKKRDREIVFPRQVGHYFSKLLTNDSLAVIGVAIGNKDHATVLSSCKKVNNLYDTEKKTRKIIDELEVKLRNIKIHGIEKANKMKSLVHVKILVVAYRRNLNKVALLVNQIIELEKRIDEILNR